jgi:hypothetical protein
MVFSFRQINWRPASGAAFGAAYRRAQRIQARGVRISVAFDGPPDCRGDSSKFVVGQVNCRHGDRAPIEYIPPSILLFFLAYAVTRGISS